MIEAQYEAIDPAVDAAFRSLLMQFFDDPTRDLWRVSHDLLPPFQAVALDYIFANPDAETARKYYKNLRFIWADYFRQGRFQDAETYLSVIVGPIHRREDRTGIQVPKGPVYYFMAGTALLQGDLDRAFLLMHTSYREDVRIGAPHPTPAAKFVTLDFGDALQFFGPSVSIWADHLDQFIVQYRLMLPSQFTKEDFLERFLRPMAAPDVVFSFTYTLARLEHLERISPYVRASDFAAQFKLNLLFDLGLVIDNAIAAKYTSPHRTSTLTPELLSHLSHTREWALTPGHLSNTVNQDVRARGFDPVVLDLVDLVYTLPHAVVSPRLETDMILAYVIRNKGAHDVSTSRAVGSRFPDVLQSMFNVLLLVIDTLYP